MMALGLDLISLANFIRGRADITESAAPAPAGCLDIEMVGNGHESSNHF
jgi:hypothetical protein